MKAIKGINYKALLVFALGSGFYFSSNAPLFAAEEVKDDSNESTAEDSPLHSLKESLSIQLVAISRYEVLAQKVKGKDNEREFLTQLVEAYGRASSIQIQLINQGALAESETSNFHQNLSKLLKSSDRFLELAAKEKNALRDSRIPLIRFQRAKALKELGQIKQAIEEYKLLADKYPKTSEAHNGVVLQTTLQMDIKDFKGAIDSLIAHQSHFPKSYQTLVLDRLTQVHLQLNQFSEALVTARKLLIAQIQAGKKISDPTALGSQSRPEVRMAFETLAGVYAEAIAKGVEGFSIPGAILALQGKEFGKDFTVEYVEEIFSGLKHLAYQFVEKGRSDSLGQLIAELNLLSKKDDRYAAIGVEVLTVSLEMQAQKRDFKKSLATLSVIKELFKQGMPPKVLDRVFKSVGKVAYLVQEKSALSTKAQNETLLTLVACYEILLKQYSDATVDPLQVKQLAGYHFNVAEASVGLEAYAVAVPHYHWIVSHEKLLEGSAGLVQDSWLRAIRVRYLELKAHGKIPEASTASTTLPEGQIENSKMDPVLVQWTQWVSEAVVKYPNVAALEMFQFEAARVTFLFGDKKAALDLLTQFVNQRPKSAYATAAGALVLEAQIAQKDWQSAGQTSKKWLAGRNFNDSELNSKMTQIGFEADYQNLVKLYGEKKYLDVLKLVEALQKGDPELKGVRIADSLVIGTNAALAAAQIEVALLHIASLKKCSKKAAQLTFAHLTESKIYAKRWQWSYATTATLNFLRSPLEEQKKLNEDLVALKSKLLQYAWLSGEISLLRKVTLEKGICEATLLTQCRKFELRALLMPSLDPTKNPKGFLEQLTRAKNLTKSGNPLGSDEALFLAIGQIIENQLASKGEAPHSGAQALAEQLQLIDDVVQGFTSLDEVSKVAAPALIAPYWNRQLVSLREQIKKVYPVQLKREVLANRVAQITKMESTVKFEGQLPWTEHRIALLNTVSGLYADFVNEVRALKAPSGLKSEDLKGYLSTLEQVIEPYLAKGKELTEQTYRFAADFKLKPDQLKAVQDLRAWAFPSDRTDIALGVDSQSPVVIPALWYTVTADQRQAKVLLNFFDNKNWPATAYLLIQYRDLSDQKNKDPDMHLARYSLMLSAVAQKMGSYTYSQQQAWIAESKLGKSMGIDSRSIASDGDSQGATQ